MRRRHRHYHRLKRLYRLPGPWSSCCSWHQTASPRLTRCPTPLRDQNCELVRKPRTQPHRSVQTPLTAGAANPTPSPKVPPPLPAQNTLQYQQHARSSSHGARQSRMAERGWRGFHRETARRRPERLRDRDQVPAYTRCDSRVGQGDSAAGECGGGQPTALPLLHFGSRQPGRAHTAQPADRGKSGGAGCAWTRNI